MAGRHRDRGVAGMRAALPTSLKLKLVTAALLLAFCAPAALAQDRAGEFDSYLLALSWIPAYCATDGDERDDPRCEDGRRVGWAVHGLWPQHDDGGWPEYCHTSQRSPSRQTLSSIPKVIAS